MPTLEAAPRLVRVLLNCVVEARPPVLAMFLLRYAAGAALGAAVSGPAGPYGVRVTETAAVMPRVLAGAVVWMLAILFAYLLNGVADVREDKANGSPRPIATGALPSASATAVAAAAAVLALGGAALLGPVMTLSVVALIALGHAYSMPPLALKRHALGGPVTGMAAVFFTYLAGYAGTTQWSAPSGGAIAFAVVMALWVGLVGTFAKDLPDVPGDAAAGRRTVGVLYGETLLRRAAVASAACLCGMLWSATAFAPELTPSAWALTGGAAAVAALALSRMTQGVRTAKRRVYRAFMAAQYVTHVCLLVSVGVTLDGVESTPLLSTGTGEER
jgi:4-hydroxybenzoate polyprenyltransferase